MRLGDVAAAVGKGLFAGAAGTAMMTMSSTAEMKIRRREASSAPARAAGKVLGVEPKEGSQRFSRVAHWGYGTGVGALRGLIALTGLRGPVAGALHFAVVWGNELALLPALEVAPPVGRWGAREVGIDVWHHLVYAAATSAAYEYLDR